MKKIIHSMVFLIVISNFAVSQTGIFLDKRDDKTYKWIKIGEQVWMAENLAFSPSIFGPCGYTAGCLYNWNNANLACPQGWHLPSDTEWTQLINFVGSNSGTKLKSINGWQENGNGTDEYGFAALPGGILSLIGTYNDYGHLGFWWSATDDEISSALAWARGMYFNYEEVDRFLDDKKHGLSVRCVRENEPTEDN